MCKVVLERGGFANFTSISNVFIDEYMPKANGEFVKIYLHLLRLIGSGEALSQELSTEKIADKFNLLESDVMRALNYWCEQGLLSLTFDDAHVLTGIKLESIIRNRYIVNGLASIAESMQDKNSSIENTPRKRCRGQPCSPTYHQTMLTTTAC